MKQPHDSGSQARSETKSQPWLCTLYLSPPPMWPHQEDTGILDLLPALSCPKQEWQRDQHGRHRDEGTSQSWETRPLVNNWFKLTSVWIGSCHLFSRRRACQMCNCLNKNKYHLKHQHNKICHTCIKYFHMEITCIFTQPELKLTSKMWQDAQIITSWVSHINVFFMSAILVTQ